MMLHKKTTALIGKLVITAKNLAKSLGIDESGYRLLWNTNKDAMQTVFHIHLHLIGGTMLKAI
jgi:histidine triad (HIT) family protein